MAQSGNDLFQKLEDLSSDPKNPHKSLEGRASLANLASKRLCLRKYDREATEEDI